MSLTTRRLLGVTGSVTVTAAVALAAVAVPSATVGSNWTAAAAPRLESSVVLARPGHLADAAAAVRASGGHVGVALPLVNGFAAHLSAAAAARLDRSSAIVSVTDDATLTSADSSYDPTVSGASFQATSRATTAWNEGDTGQGVTVAVLDTGVSDVPDLNGRLIQGPDFSGEGNSLEDSFGHGTVMAGIIAGDGSSSGGAYPGIAPGARVLSVKVAGRSGATDVSTVLAGLEWIAVHKSQYDIGVVNLAWGTPSHQPTQVDPLDFAVEQLWADGITVVVAAGNTGPGPMTITKPGDDPAVITVGAYDDGGTVATDDDAALDFSARGPTTDGVAKPDLVAPGRTVIATAAPGSTVVANNPQALVDGGYIRGSGTSQATAVTTGAVALMLSARHWLSPDQVKYALTSTARPITGVDPTVQGAGELRTARALWFGVAAAPQQALQSTGLGSLEASRGGMHVSVICPGSDTPTEIIGEMDAQCQPFSSAAWVADTWFTDTWFTDTWFTDTWFTDTWFTDTWFTDTWFTDTWFGDTWNAPPAGSHPTKPTTHHVSHWPAKGCRCRL